MSHIFKNILLISPILSVLLLIYMAQHVQHIEANIDPEDIHELKFHMKAIARYCRFHQPRFLELLHVILEVYPLLRDMLTQLRKFVPVMEMSFNRLKTAQADLSIL